MAVEAVVQRARRSVRHGASGDWLERVARVGFVARGVLYLTVAFLAVSIARGRSDEQADKLGAVRTLADSSLGTLLLVVLVVGFVGLALWRAAEALWGQRQEHDETKRTAKRATSGGKALLYLALAGTAASVLFGKDEPKGGGGGSEQETEWTAWLFEQPGGRVLGGVIGVAVVAGGAWLVVRGLRQKFEEHLDLHAMPRAVRRVATAGGTIGHGARGVVIGLIGLLLVKAAIDFDPQEAKGVDGTLRTLAAQPFGKALLLLAAAGLAVFGLFSLVEARFRRIET